MKNRTLHYIIRFLVGDDVPSELVETIGYTADPNKFDRYNVVIIPSGFFDGQTYGTPASLPELPLQEVQGIPLLFGSPKEIHGWFMPISSQVLIFSFPDTRRWYGVDFGMSMEDFPVKSPCPTGPVSCIVRSWMNIACCFIVGCANPGYVYPR